MQICQSNPLKPYQDSMKTFATTLFIALAATMQADAVAAGKNLLKETDKAFFNTEEARRVGDQVVIYQRDTGGWPKNIDMWSPMNDEEMKNAMADKSRTDDSTIDNNATIMQMKYLARLYMATGDEKYRDSFAKGLEYLLAGQYENGGWPQFWPNPKGYKVHITYNDNAMLNVLGLLKDIGTESLYRKGLVSDSLTRECSKAFDKGIECILRTQIVVDGKPTVWCQQHDRETLLPAPARKFELASYCSLESVGLVYLLLDIKNPDERVKASIKGAMEWFDRNKITGMRYVRRGNKGDADCDSWLEPDPEASPIWARYYDLENCRPFVCDRDGVPRERLDQIGHERRNGYGWYNDRPLNLIPIYEEWKKENGVN